MNKYLVLAMIGSVAACNNEPVKSTIYQAPVVTAAQQEKADRAMAKEISDKIYEATNKQFCAQFKSDKGCTPETCVMSTDDSGRCIVYKQVPGNVCQNKNQCSVGEMCLIDNPKSLTGKCVKIK